MELLATVRDIETRIGRVLVDPELGRVVGLLEDASDLVRLEAGVVDGETWLLDPDTDLPRSVPGSVAGVVRRMVERAVRNPEGFSAESDGDYSYQRVQVQPGVYLTDAERAIIRRCAGRSGLSVVQTTRGEDFYATGWAEDQFGCELFPLDVYRPGIDF